MSAHFDNDDERDTAILLTLSTNVMIAKKLGISSDEYPLLSLAEEAARNFWDRAALRRRHEKGIF